MRYLLEDRHIEPAAALARYRLVLAWAVARTDRFVIRLRPEAYDDRGDVEPLLALGEVAVIASRPPPQGLLSWLFRTRRSSGGSFVEVRGTPDDRLHRLLTQTGPPRRAISGDLAPVEDVELHVDDRTLYGVYEYGRDQVLELSDDELSDLQRVLRDGGFEPEQLIPAPAQGRGGRRG